MGICKGWLVWPAKGGMDMEELKTIEEFAKLSEEDYMTGLLNRRGGIRRINEYIKDIHLTIEETNYQREKNSP